MTRSPWAAILTDIVLERGRQEQLRAEGRFKHTAASSVLTDGDRLAILAEEFGEVGRAILESEGLASDLHGKALREELVQLAAVCVAWLEAIDAERGGFRSSSVSSAVYADPEPPHAAPAEEVGARGHHEAQDREAHEEEVAPPGRHGEVRP